MFAKAVLLLNTYKESDFPSSPKKLNILFSEKMFKFGISWMVFSEQLVSKNPQDKLEVTVK